MTQTRYSSVKALKQNIAKLALCKMRELFLKIHIHLFYTTLVLPQGLFLFQESKTISKVLLSLYLRICILVVRNLFQKNFSRYIFPNVLKYLSREFFLVLYFTNLLVSRDVQFCFDKNLVHY